MTIPTICIRSSNTFGRVSNQWEPAREHRTDQLGMGKSRLSPSRRGYDRRWVKFRRWHLTRNPMCRHCGQLATEIDHIQPLAKGGEKYSEGNLQALCKSCHSKKTHAEQHGRRIKGSTIDGIPLWRLLEPDE